MQPQLTQEQIDEQIGVWFDLPNEDYHNGPGISKSGLWTIYTKTPAHFIGAPKKESKAFDFGSAVDIAILQPDDFEKKVIRGPVDRRGNKWTAAEAEATNTGKLLLTSDDFDRCLLCRDTVLANSDLERLIRGGVAGETNLRQASAYVQDKRTGLLVRARPDLVRTDLHIMVDLKTCRDASPRAFSKAVAEYGYHAQEAVYTGAWKDAGEEAIDGFLFLAVESEPPFVHQIYELKPSAVAEGAMAMRQALTTYAECLKTDTWPAYSTKPEELGLPRWAFKLTPATDIEED